MSSPPAHHSDQSAFAYRFDWGADGLDAVGPGADVIVIVDVLRFTTAVTCALEGRSVVLPYEWAGPAAGEDQALAEFAQANGAVVAGTRESGPLSLSPTDLLTMEAETRLVLPSPNGSTLSRLAGAIPGKRVLAASLRNPTATARSIRATRGLSVAVIAAGERWGNADGALRPAVEDLLGAGALLAALDPSGSVGPPHCSPEARAARAAFLDMRPRLYDALRQCSSGVELLGRGWEDDVATSAALDVSAVVAELVDGAYVRV